MENYITVLDDYCHHLVNSTTVPVFFSPIMNLFPDKEREKSKGKSSIKQAKVTLQGK
jgi:hypothetical protein